MIYNDYSFYKQNYQSTLECVNEHVEDGKLSYQKLTDYEQREIAAFIAKDSDDVDFQSENLNLAISLFIRSDAASIAHQTREKLFKNIETNYQEIIDDMFLKSAEHLEDRLNENLPEWAKITDREENIRLDNLQRAPDMRAA